MAKKKPKKKSTAKQAPKCCTGCARWELFGKECWVYWENKKECTMHSEKE